MTSFEDTPTIDLTPEELDLELYAGDGVSLPFTILDKNEEPVPLIGTIQAQIRVKRNTPDPPSAEFTVDSTGWADGKVRLVLSGEDTQSLASSSKFHGVWDLQWTPTDEISRRTLVQGKVVCRNDVSR